MAAPSSKRNRPKEDDEQEDVEIKAGTWGGGESIAEQTEMWGDRASRALIALSGKSTGHTSYENEMMKKQRLRDQRAETSRVSNLKFEKTSHGQSRASLRRKKKGKQHEIQQGGANGEDVVRMKLEAFYQQYAPNKLDSIPTLITKFQGNEGALFELLEEKYCSSDVNAKKSPKAITELKNKKQKKVQRNEGKEEGEMEENRDKNMTGEGLKSSNDISKKNKKNKKGGSKKESDEVITGELDDLETLNLQNVNFFISEARKKPKKQS